MESASRDVSICICTFRRESVTATLASLENIIGRDRVCEVIVIDNDTTPSARERIEAFAAGSSLPLRYVHAPACNISIARNEALDVAMARWVAFIDDDEIALPNWLLELLAKREGHSAVIGQSRALYGKGLPAWVAKCDFHSNRIKGEPENAYTSNALIDIGFVRENGLRFDHGLGQTGGEDTLFFRQMAGAGGTIVYAPASVVEEGVPASRATMQWVLRRHYRAGQTHALVLQRLAPAAYRKLMLSAGAKAAYCLLMALLTLPRGNTSRRWLARGSLHAGAVNYVLRPGLLREYAS